MVEQENLDSDGTAADVDTSLFTSTPPGEWVPYQGPEVKSLRGVRTPLSMINRMLKLNEL